MLKLLCCFLSLLLSLCLLFPVFSVSTSAININGYNVITKVYDPQLSDYKEFENTLSLNASEKSVRIIFEIQLPEVIKKNTLFDLSVDFNIGQYLTISEWNGGGFMYDSNWTQLDGKLPGIVQNGRLIESEIIAPGDVKYIRYEFDIYDPTWITINGPSWNGTDLTGTNWLFNNVITSYPPQGLQLDGTLSSGQYSLSTNSSCKYIVFISNDNIHFFSSSNTKPQNPSSLYFKWYQRYNWNFFNNASQGINVDPPLFTITGGTDVTNSSAISWLQSNAVLQNSQTEGVQYTFDFSVLSVTVIQDEEQSGIFAGIFGWIKKIFNVILDMPNLIGSKLTAFGNWLIDQIKGLFVPSEETIIELKDKFEALLSDRFGAAYQSIEVVEQFGQAMGISTYSDTVDTITFPSVTVPLAGTEFTFGGWEVDLVPKGFEGLITPLKLIVDLVCTIACVNMFRRRMEGVLR